MCVRERDREREIWSVQSCFIPDSVHKGYSWQCSGNYRKSWGVNHFPCKASSWNSLLSLSSFLWCKQSCTLFMSKHMITQGNRPEHIMEVGDSILFYSVIWFQQVLLFPPQNLRSMKFMITWMFKERIPDKLHNWESFAREPSWQALNWEPLWEGHTGGVTRVKI